MNNTAAAQVERLFCFLGRYFKRMNKVMSTQITDEASLPTEVVDELANYEEQIGKYRAGEVDETKMQKLRLHFGTYAQRQEGVQMQRIKIPGGFLTSDQLVRLADAADRYGSGFMHFTTREDVQIYYLDLLRVPELLRFLAAAGITSREACGNTVRNITACYLSGTSATEAFDVSPYATALFRYLVRNKYNQNLGRKFKITFEGCAEDHSRLRIHDIGLWAVNGTRNGISRRGFRVYLGGGLGAAPHLARLYTEFLPVEELFNLVASCLRLFDRYGERKARMKARMKFLVESLGWEQFRATLDEERDRVGFVPLPEDLSAISNDIDFSAFTQLSGHSPLQVLPQQANDPHFQSWGRDSVIRHKLPQLRGVHVRVKLGDLTAVRARELAEVARQFSAGQMRITIDQNIYLPWVCEHDLLSLYHALGQARLADPGVGTIADVTTCPGSDTCRLGIASAKGLGSALDEAFNNGLAKYAELARPLSVKISGCPNGCAQHSIANIGFYSAALSQDERTVPAHFVTVGGQTHGDNAQFGSLLGKFPAKNCVKVTETLLELFADEKLRDEDFNSFTHRLGTDRLRQALESLLKVPSFEDDPSFYEDYGHEHERFAVRKGVKGECAGSTVAATVPTLEAAHELLAQAEAFSYHKEFAHTVLTAYEAAAAAARVLLYQRLVDPFTAEEALWEFENLFVLSGETAGHWRGISSTFDEFRQIALRFIRLAESQQTSADQQTENEDESIRLIEATASRILEQTHSFLSYCASVTVEEAVAVA